MSGRMLAGELAEICSTAGSALGVAGSQVALSVGGSLLTASTGTANRELDRPVTDRTVFQIGSVSKLWTATLVMQLVDAGRLDLDTPVAHYLPDVPFARGDGWKAVTPRHLMSMSSGLDNGQYVDTGQGDDCIEKNVRLLADLPMLFEPGSAFGYSNGSSRVSGLLFERLTGLTWDAGIAARISRPAKLTEVVSQFTDLAYFPVAVGHHPHGGAVNRVWTLGRGMGPSGSTLTISARDLVRFARVFLSGGSADDGTRLLSPSAVAQMHTPQVRVPVRSVASDWCLGPYRQDWGGVDVFGHMGAAQNGASTLLWIPEADLAMAVITNTPSLGGQFAAKVFDAVLREGMGLAAPDHPAPLGRSAPSDADIYVGRYESFGRYYEVRLEGDCLVLTLRTEDGWTIPAGADKSPAGHGGVRSVLLPIGEHRFLAEDPAVTWGFGWELAITPITERRATLLYNGPWVARRVDI